MKMDKIESAIQQTMAAVFEIRTEEIDHESTQDNVASWDSLKHLDLVIALEEEFGIIFPEEEIGNLGSFRLVVVIVKELLEKKATAVG